MNNISGMKLGNRYTLIEKVGDGGMALVYKAKDELLNRNVAVKVLRPEYMADEDFVRKFKSESQAVASLSHPNIVNIFDVGNEEGLSYIVMEYIEGIDLKDYIKKHGKLDYKETLKIVKQIAKALEHAHKNGVVHRDIKPHNILIKDEGIVKVADFGIARAATSATMTNTKSVMGSVHYVSPEQAKGSFTDNRTDIYSLGIVMYELLTGMVPFDGESPIAIAIKHIQEEIKNPSEINPSIPKGVCDILLKATGKDPLNRYQSLTEMITDINLVEKNPSARIGVANDLGDSTRVIPIEEIEKAMQDRTMKVNLSENQKSKEEEYDDFDDFDDEYDDYDEDEYESERKQKIKQKSKQKSGKSKKLLISLIVIVAVFIVGAGGIYALMSSSPKDVAIPKVIGLTEDKAKQTLQSLNLVVGESVKQKSDKPSGEVIGVSPSEGMNVKEKSTVTLTVSDGEETSRVPSLKDLSLEEAKSELELVGLELGDTDKDYSSVVDKNKIISQSEDEGTEVPKGTKINIVISRGEKEVLSKVPSLVGKTADEAAASVKAAGLNLGSVVYGSDPKYPNGVVIDQTIKSGKSIKAGSSIDITINKIEQNNEQQGNNGNNGNDNTDNNTTDKNNPSTGNNNQTQDGNTNNQGNSSTDKKETNE